MPTVRLVLKEVACKMNETRKLHLSCQTSALQPLWFLVQLIARRPLRHFDPNKNSIAKRTLVLAKNCCFPQSVALPKPSKTIKSPLHHLQGDVSSLLLLPEPVKHVVTFFILGDRRLQKQRLEKDHLLILVISWVSLYSRSQF